MKLQIMSDLHLEFDSYTFEVPSVGADALLLAGDIGLLKDPGYWCWLARTLPGTPKYIIPGNHEFYGWRFFPTKDIALNWPLPEVTWLHRGANATPIKPDQRLIGCTLWTDFDQEREIFRISQAMSDYRVIKDFSPTKVVLREHKADLAYLSANVQGAIVMTHHAPSWQSVPPEFKGNPINGAYVSNLDHVASKAKLWVHGHTHTTHDYMIGDCRVVCNPRGYHPNHLNPTFDPTLTVTL